MKSFKTLISMIVFGMAMAPAVQAEDATVHYFYLTVAQDSENAYATMSSNTMNLRSVDCPFRETVCEVVDLAEAEGVAYYADRPAAYQVTDVMEVSGSDARVARTRPVLSHDHIPGVGPVGPVDPVKILREVLEDLVGRDGIVTEEYASTYYLLIQITYAYGQYVVSTASNVLDLTCGRVVDTDAPWCGMHVNIHEPPQGTVYYTDKADAYKVTDVIENPDIDERTAVTIPTLGDDIIPGVGPVGPVDPVRIVKEVIGEINGVLCSQLQCQGQPINP